MNRSSQDPAQLDVLSTLLALRQPSPRIVKTEAFAIDLPGTPAQIASGVYHRYSVVRITTSDGVRGYSFAGPRQAHLRPLVVEATEGFDLFDVEGMLRRGLNRCFGAEHAVWDAIGKTLNKPASSLLGGRRQDRLKAYVTLVWPGLRDQSHVNTREIVETILHYRDSGFAGAKIRAWRQPKEVIAICEDIVEATGSDFALMVDRTAHLSGSTWSYDEAVAVACELQSFGVHWLEEPLDRFDFDGQARLANAVDIRIAGGEGYDNTEDFETAIRLGSFDVLQPDAGTAGGLLETMKAASLAAEAGVPVCLHGTGGLRLAGWLSAAAAIGPEWQELALLTPNLSPQDAWKLSSIVVDQDNAWEIVDGKIRIPTGPGLGLTVNDASLERFITN